jgi:glycerophosphoryl diester phosphodiesterase
MGMIRVSYYFLFSILLFVLNSGICQNSCSFSPIGHRGYSNLFPENTLLSLEEAFRRGVKYCEVDVSVTLDDVYILFHDEESIYRTTDGRGRISEKTLLEMKALDAGTWKGVQFAGTKIATLQEAVLLAEQFDAQLYLDTKDYRPDLIKHIIEETKVNPKRLMPALESLNAAREFRELLPNSPWVWYNGGYFPEDINSANFYKDCMDLGCIAFEVSSSAIGDPMWQTFEQNVHSVGGLVWAFTVNDNGQARNFYELGADGLESDRAPDLSRTVCDRIDLAYPDSLTTGNWRFKSDLSAFGVGSQLRPFQYVDTPSDQLPIFETCGEFGISTINQADVLVMKVPKQSSENGLLVYSGFSVEENGTLDDSYSLILDFLIPAESYGNWISIYQTDMSNTDDSELFVSPDGSIGTIGEYSGHVDPDQWYRLVITVDTVSKKIIRYLDGAPIGGTQTYGSRWSIFNSSPRGENQGIRLLTDNDGETETIYLSALQIRNYPISPEAAQLLGGPTELGIPLSNADLWNLKIANVPYERIFLDYDRQKYDVYLTDNTDLSEATIRFDLSFGAISTYQSGENQLTADSIGFEVRSQDGAQTKKWSIIVHRPVQILDVPTIISLKAYPNPADRMIIIPCDQPKTAFVSVYDLSGKRYPVRTEPTQNGLMLEVIQLKDGIYFYELFGNVQAYGKFIVDHR